MRDVLCHSNDLPTQRRKLAEVKNFERFLSLLFKAIVARFHPHLLSADEKL